VLNERQKKIVYDAIADWEKGYQKIAWRLNSFFTTNSIRLIVEEVCAPPEINLSKAQRGLQTAMRILQENEYIDRTALLEAVILWKIGGDYLDSKGRELPQVRGGFPIQCDDDLHDIIDKSFALIPSRSAEQWRFDIVEPTQRFATEWRDRWKGIQAELREEPGDAPQYITLDRAAALVKRSKRTLEKYKNRRGRKRLPMPAIKGMRGQADEWDYGVLKPWLEETFGPTRKLPDRLPSWRKA